MSLEKVLSISGKPGLYKMTKQTRSGFLAASLIDQKIISVSARHNVSLLTEIAIYTLTQEAMNRQTRVTGAKALIAQRVAARPAVPRMPPPTRKHLMTAPRGAVRTPPRGFTRRWQAHCLSSETIMANLPGVGLCLYKLQRQRYNAGQGGG